MSIHNCKIRTEAGSEFVKRVVEVMQTSNDYLLLLTLNDVLQDLLQDGKISQDIWFEATNAWARVREIIDDREE